MSAKLSLKMAVKIMITTMQPGLFCIVVLLRFFKFPLHMHNHLNMVQVCSKLEHLHLEFSTNDSIYLPLCRYILLINTHAI